MKRKKIHCDQNELNELQTIRISQILSFNKTIHMNRSGIARLSRSWNESALFSTSPIQIGFKHLSLRLSSKTKGFQNAKPAPACNPGSISLNLVHLCRRHQFFQSRRYWYRKPPFWCDLFRCRGSPLTRAAKYHKVCQVLEETAATAAILVMLICMSQKRPLNSAKRGNILM